MLLRASIVLGVAGLALSLVSHVRAADCYPKGELLIESRELANQLGSFIVLDARPRDAYDAGHVPGSVWVPHTEWERAFYEDEGSNLRAWQQRIASLGVTAERPIVVYDDNLAKDAARIWWILRFFGAQDVRLLNGGWKGWSSGSHPLSDQSPQVTLSDFRAAPKKQLFRGLPATLASVMSGSSIQIVDARSNDEHCGIELFKNERGGAIPGAKHLEWSDLLDKHTARFKSKEEIGRLFADAGIDPKKPTVTHCQSGGRASVMAFGIELMGGDQVANYYRGWSEWGNSAETPIEGKKKAASASTSD